MIEWHSYVLVVIAIVSGVIAFKSRQDSKASVKEVKSAREFDIFNSMYGYMYTLLKDIHLGKLDEDEKKGWDDIALNTIEYWSMLVNDKKIVTKKYAEFFDDLVITYHEQNLKKYHQDQFQDPKEFEELKKLYKHITSKKITPNKS